MVTDFQEKELYTVDQIKTTITGGYKISPSTKKIVTYDLSRVYAWAPWPFSNKNEYELRRVYLLDPDTTEIRWYDYTKLHFRKDRKV
jgi:hypothetical protein